MQTTIMSAVLTLCIFGLNSARAANISFEILKNSNGKLLYLKYDDAIAHCVGRGEHLPSARELAEISATMGSKGILETNYISTILNGLVPDGYTEVSVQNTDETGLDDFYFSNEGFDKSLKIIKDATFWSTSLNPVNFNNVACFDGGDGGVDLGHGRSNYRNYHQGPSMVNAVFCGPCPRVS